MCIRDRLRCGAGFHCQSFVFAVVQLRSAAEDDRRPTGQLAVVFDLPWLLVHGNRNDLAWYGGIVFDSKLNRRFHPRRRIERALGFLFKRRRDPVRFDLDQPLVRLVIATTL